jgi:hypothetical protein
MSEPIVSTPPTPSERPDGSSPDQAVPAENVGKRPTPRYFNFVVHEAVQRLFSLGIWCALGPRFGGLNVRLRPFHVGAVVAKREAAERSVRVRLGLNDNDDIPGEEQIGITRAAVTMAVTDLDGYVNCGSPGVDSQDPEILALNEAAGRSLTKARDLGLEIVEEGGLVLVHFVALTGKVSADERLAHAKLVRDVFAPQLESITLLTQLFNTSRALQRVRDEEIYRLGEGYVYGRPGEFDWAD